MTRVGSQNINLVC